MVKDFQKLLLMNEENVPLIIILFENILNFANFTKQFGINHWGRLGVVHLLRSLFREKGDFVTVQTKKKIFLGKFVTRGGGGLKFSFFSVTL